MGKSKDSEPHSVCANCGASIYKEHIDSGIARHEDDKLLCSVCVSEYERNHDATLTGAEAQPDFIRLDVDDDEYNEDELLGKTGIRVSAGKLLSESSGWDEARFTRPLQPRTQGASRCRIFHAKLSEGAIEFMVNQINDWLERNKDISIKFATSSIGMFEAKHTEPNIILTVFY